MKRVLKQAVKKIMPEFVLRELQSMGPDPKAIKITDKATTLIYIIIGKCGGASIQSAIDDSKILQDEFSEIYQVHIAKPQYLKTLNILL